MKQSVLWLAVLGTLCGLGLLEYHQISKPTLAKPHVDESTALSGTVAELQQQLTALKQKTVGLEARLAQPTAPVVKPDRPTETAPASGSDRFDPQEEQRLTAEVMNRYERRFAQDGPTSDWAREVEGSLRSTIRELGPDAVAQVIAIACRSKMCKLTTEHGSATAAATFMDDMEAHPGFRGSKFVRIRTESGREAYEFFVEPRSEQSSPIVQ